jgi:RNA polymerase sigma-70 factor (ECF subfamily)
MMKSTMTTTEQFETIVSEHYESLYRFAMSLTRTESDAWDLTQQTFYVWATKGHQLRDFSKVKTWLFTTLHRAFLVSTRRQNKFTNDEDVLEQIPESSSFLPLPSDLALTLAALARVDEIYQAAVALYYLEDCSYRDIASILDVPVGTVKSRIARGIAQLREIFLSGKPVPVKSEPARSARSLIRPDQETCVPFGSPSTKLEEGMEPEGGHENRMIRADHRTGKSKLSAPSNAPAQALAAGHGTLVPLAFGNRSLLCESQPC